MTKPYPRKCLPIIYSLRRIQVDVSEQDIGDNENITDWMDRFYWVARMGVTPC